MVSDIPLLRAVAKPVRAGTGLSCDDEQRAALSARAMGRAPGGTRVLTQLTFTATFEVAVTLVPCRDKAGLSVLPSGTVSALVTLPRAREAETETFLPALPEVSRGQNHLDKSTGRGKSRKGLQLPHTAPFGPLPPRLHIR